MEELTELIQTGKNDRLKEVITNDPRLADEKTAQGVSLLQFAAYCRNTVAIELIRQHKTSIGAFEAACVGDSDTVNRLLEETPDQLNAFSSDGFTLLGFAAFFGHIPLVKQLLAKGADPNIAANNPFKVAPLHSACAISNYEIADLLLKAGADVNATQAQGVTPLHSAAHNGQKDLANLLIDYGAKVNVPMDDGKTPLAMAEEKGYHDMMELLKKRGGK